MSLRSTFREQRTLPLLSRRNAPPEAWEHADRHRIYGMKRRWLQNIDRSQRLFKRRKRDLNPCAGATDLLVFEARPFSHLGIPPYIWIANYCIIH
mgnify:CR=1 FL=1